ncbi:MAG: hypothetical protein ACOX2F_10500 [bacterium]
MKLGFKLVAVAFVSLAISFSCFKEEPPECITGIDCGDGFACVNGSCVPLETGSENEKNDDIEEQIEEEVTFDHDNEQAEDEDFEDDLDETPDEEEPNNDECHENRCSGFGTCETVDGKAVCTCDEYHTGNSCNECVEGTLKSYVDGRCKPDCEFGEFNCTGNKKCRVDSDTNEAGCACEDFFFGDDCKECDMIKFCSNHGTCSAPSGAPICTCFGNWSNSDCSFCDPAEFIIHENDCVKNCDPSCGQPESLFNQASHGTCDLSSGFGKCVCDQGWKTPIVTFPPMVPECSECNTSNPPPGGCPEE